MRRNLVLLVLFLALAGVAADLSVGIHIDRHEGERYVTSFGLSSLAVRYQGEIELTDNELEITRLSPDAHLVISHRRLFTTRRLTVSAAPDGDPEYELLVASTPASEEEARRFLRRHLPEIARTTAIGAEARGRRLLAAFGPDRLLAAAADLRSDAAREVYYRLLLDSGPDPLTAERLVTSMGREIDSGARLGDLLVRGAHALPRTAAVTRSLYLAATEIASSSTSASTIRSIFAERGSEGAEEALGLAIAAITSSTEKESVITALARVGTTRTAQTEQLARASRSIDSSSSQSRALGALLSQPGVSRAGILACLEAAEEISSSTDRARLLTQAAPLTAVDSDLVSSYLSVARGIDASAHQYEAFRALVRQPDLEPSECGHLLASAREISASSDLTRLLEETAAFCPLTQPVWERYLQATAAISSSSGQRMALTALLARPELPAAASRAILEFAAEEISSRTDRESVEAQARKRLGTG